MSVTVQERAPACRTIGQGQPKRAGRDWGDEEEGLCDSPVYRREYNMHGTVVWNGEQYLSLSANGSMLTVLDLYGGQSTLGWPNGSIRNRRKVLERRRVSTVGRTENVMDWERTTGV